MQIANSEIAKFFHFLLKPSLLKVPANKIVITAILPMTILLVVVSILLGLITEIPFVINYFCIRKDLLEEDLLKKGALYSFGVGCIVAPMIEEFLFRFYLNKLFGNAMYFFINLFIVIYIFYGIPKYQIAIYILISTIILFLFSALLERNYFFRKKIFTFFKNHFYIFFYFSAITFAVVHIPNLEICKTNTALAVFLVSPQLFGGFVLGYARLKWGLSTSIIIHSITNVMGIGMLFLTK